MTRKRIIWLVERFYEAVRLTMMTWWIFIKNFIVYGLLDVSCLLTSYMMQPERDRDSIKKYLKETKCKLKNRRLISFLITLLFIAWLCIYIFLLRNKDSETVFNFIFWILSIWLILIGVYVSMLGLTWASAHYEQDIQYYAQAFANIARKPLISLLALTFWLMMYLLGIRSPILLIFVLPGLLIELKVGEYKREKRLKELRKQ